MSATGGGFAAQGPGDSSWFDELAAVAALPSGEDFFVTLLARLGRLVEAPLAFVTESLEGSRMRLLATHPPGGVDSDRGLDSDAAACSGPAGGETVVIGSGAGSRFADGHALARWRFESYAGVPLLDPGGQVVGHLAVGDRQPRAWSASVVAALRIGAARAAAELARLRLERTLGESEERLRDLFDEAPIAYVHEDLESRFLRANRAALRILGVKPEEAVGTVGMSLVPDTPEAQRRVREAFASVGRGTDTSGVVLELRRKDDGRPIWIQWWSKPDPSGTYTRTMFLDITDRVLMEREQVRLREQNRYLREEIKSVHNFEEIVGCSRALGAVLEEVARVAPTEASVLITGETGTGKELIARAIHSASQRHDRPLIKLNCAALPSSLVESELFGHEKGAFSGAIARRIGRFELANHGTIFLDEIGELPLEVQAKLLRVLQEREFERVGSSESIKVDLRVIAATNRDLTRAVREGKFREDLYYRLAVFPIQVPPLRERLDDVPPLLQFFIDKCAARVGKRIDGASPELLEHLLAYAWPGNVRELENIVERAVILASTPTLELVSTPLATAAKAPEAGSLQEVERQHVLAMLEQSGWVIEGSGGAARILGLHPNTLRSRMKKLGITRDARSRA